MQLDLHCYDLLAGYNMISSTSVCDHKFNLHSIDGLFDPWHYQDIELRKYDRILIDAVTTSRGYLGSSPATDRH
jgi:hypothetical protein